MFLINIFSHQVQKKYLHMSIYQNEEVNKKYLSGKMVELNVREFRNELC